MPVRSAPVLILAVAALAVGCGGPDADPEQALRAVCGDDAAISKTDSDAAVDEDYASAPLECRAGGHVFVADGATEVGPPSDPTEADRVEWVPIDELRAIIDRGEMPDGFSLTGVLHALVTGAL